MPRTPAATPIQEISIHEFFIAADARLAAFGDNPTPTAAASM